MIRYIILIAFILCSLAACRKDKDTLSGNTIQAGIYVKQYKTHTPIANAMILITRGVPPSGFGTTVIDTLYTDENGRATYNKVVDKNYWYYAEAYKENYFDTHDAQVEVRPGEKNFTTTIYMYAHSWVKLHVKNVNPFNQFDVIVISTFCYNFYLQGMFIDTSFLFCDYGFEFMADFNYGYGFNVNKNAQDTSVIFYFSPPPHDTITIDINY